MQPTNPYETTATVAISGNRTEHEERLHRPYPGGTLQRRLAVLSLIVSVAILAWMWIGGLISYAPGAVSPNEMQNIYLSRILWYGVASAVLQILAIVLIMKARQLESSL